MTHGGIRQSLCELGEEGEEKMAVVGGEEGMASLFLLLPHIL